MTPRFRSPLVIAQIGRDLWRLADDLIYEGPVAGRIFVPRGLITDLASVPRTPLAWFLAGGTGHAGAVVHDYLYQTHLYPDRALADSILYEALGAEGPGIVAEPLWRRCLMWSAVRAGGWSAWNDHAARRQRFVALADDPGSGAA